MAEEDILFGKNRHLFGGMAPSDVKIFTAYTDTDYSIHLRVKAESTIIDGQTLCSLGGVMIRRYEYSGASEYLAALKCGEVINEFKGTLVKDIAIVTVNDLIDTHITDEGYLAEWGAYVIYTAFPYSTQGVYNRSYNNMIVFSGASFENNYVNTASYIYGYDLDLDDPDPATRVSYPVDVINSTFTPIKPSDSGNWPSEGRHFMPRPCVLYPSGVVKGYLKVSDYSKYTDGTDATNDITDANKLGLNVMMEWPKIYTKRWESGGVYHFRCSNVKIDDDYECWCNINDNGEEIDHFYTGVYLCSKDDDDTWRSISGASAGSFTTITAAKEAAEANGEGWSVDRAIDRLLINDLLTMVCKTTDLQTAIGNGANSSKPAPGECNNYGMFGAGASVKVFGMEAYWCQYNRYLFGLYCNKGLISIKLPGNNRYTDVGVIQGNSNHYINGTITRNFGRFPASTGGSSTTYECDYLVYSSTANYPGYVYNGGGSSLYTGPFALYFANITSIYSSLSFKPIDRIPQSE